MNSKTMDREYISNYPSINDKFLQREKNSVSVRLPSSQDFAHFTKWCNLFAPSLVLFEVGRVMLV